MRAPIEVRDTSINGSFRLQCQRLELGPTRIAGLELARDRRELREPRLQLFGDTSIQGAIGELGFDRGFLGLERLQALGQCRQLALRLIGEPAAAAGAATRGACGRCRWCHCRGRRWRRLPLPEARPVAVATDELTHRTAAFEYQQARDDVIEKGPIVAYEQQRAGKLGHELLQELERIDIE